MMMIDIYKWFFGNKNDFEYLLKKYCGDCWISYSRMYYCYNLSTKSFIKKRFEHHKYFFSVVNTIRAKQFISIISKPMVHMNDISEYYDYAGELCYEALRLGILTPIIYQSVMSESFSILDEDAERFLCPFPHYAVITRDTIERFDDLSDATMAMMKNNGKLIKI